jgi:5-(carboxyamino)imidazole ribonucleotide mutase
MKDVLIVLGSKSDISYAEKVSGVLHDFEVSYDLKISSAHRQPDRTRKLAAEAEANGYKVIIAMAGYAAALPGFVASHTPLPVIGVPLPTSDLIGVDSALSILQMPGGVPVVSTGIGAAGAKNAALFAIRMLSVSDGELKAKLKNYIDELSRG